MKLAIGTAQFGLNYGISNVIGKTTFEEANSIINFAVDNNITCIDTAREYDDSESVLGKIILKNKIQNNLRIITKASKDSNIKEDLNKSLLEMGLNKVYGILIHNTKDLLDNTKGNIIYKNLLLAREKGLVEKIGATVYTPEQAREIIEKFNIDIIQIPCSIFDQRFLLSGALEELKTKNVEVHVRSVFLQGLFFLSPENLPSYFKPIEDKLLSLNNIAEDLKISKLKILIDYVKSLKYVDNIIVGINNLQHLKDILEAYKDNRITGINYNKFAIFDENFVNISKWRV